MCGDAKTIKCVGGTTINCPRCSQYIKNGTLYYLADVDLSWCPDRSVYSCSKYLGTKYTGVNRFKSETDALLFLSKMDNIRSISVSLRVLKCKSGEIRKMIKSLWKKI